MNVQAFLNGGLHLSIGTAVIWRIADLRHVLASDFGERTIVGVALYACCANVVRCIRTAFCR
jgi:hypothetical protein